jgi:cell division protein FtsW
VKASGQLEQRLLVLVTLALVAFGLVMVFSATSAAAALGNGDPITFLKRQGVYALLGVALMVAASRFDHRKLRNVAPPLVVVSLGLCVAVLAIAPEINGAHRWLTVGPLTFQPSELAKLALLLWAAAYLARNGAPRTLGELWKPIGMLTCLFAALIVVEPDLGTTIALVLMIGGMLAVAGVPGRTLAAAATLEVTCVQCLVICGRVRVRNEDRGRARRGELPHGAARTRDGEVGSSKGGSEFRRRRDEHVVAPVDALA